MRMEKIDSKLLQALIGTRSPIGLSLYCSSFFLSRFFDSWYEELLCTVLNEAKENGKHILHGGNSKAQFSLYGWNRNCKGKTR